MYLRIYVNDLLRTMGWAFALLMMTVLLGSVMIAVSRNRSQGKRDEPARLEMVSTEVEVPIQTPSTEVSAKPSIDLHPMVAQLKAELARTPMPIENVPLPKMEETPARNQSPAAEGPTTSSTPPTVIVGMVPVQKKARAEERPSTEEGSQPSG